MAVQFMWCGPASVTERLKLQRSGTSVIALRTSEGGVGLPIVHEYKHLGNLHHSGKGYAPQLRRASTAITLASKAYLRRVMSSQSIDALTRCHIAEGFS